MKQIIFLFFIFNLASCGLFKEELDFKKVKTISIYVDYNIRKYENTFYATKIKYCYNPPEDYPVYDYDADSMGGTLTAYVYYADKMPKKIEGKAKYDAHDRSDTAKRIHLIFHIPFEQEVTRVEIKDNKNKLLYHNTFEANLSQVGEYADRYEEKLTINEDTQCYPQLLGWRDRLILPRTLGEIFFGSLGEFFENIFSN